MENNEAASGKKHDTLPPGFLIAGRYQIVRSLGHGGMGCVYLAQDTVLGDEQIAIKVLHPDYIDDSDLMQRFLREVQLMRRVSHRNVVRTYDVGSDQNLIFFTMEYVPGRSLENIVKHEGFKREKAANLIVQICAALEAIHEVGILHRDLKPGNILVLEDGTVRITDFGVARPEVSHLTAHNEILGSVCYIAPEIWLGDAPTLSVDLYSLGIVLYEFTTGEVPFDGGSPAELMRLHLDRTPVPPSELNPEVPSWLNKLVLRLLAKSPNERPKNAREIIEYVTLRAPDELPHDEALEEEGNPAVDHLSFMEELEKQSATLTALSVSPVVRQKNDPPSKSDSETVPHPRSSAHHKIAKKSAAISSCSSQGKEFVASLRSVAASFALALLILSGARSILFALAPLPERSFASLFSAAGAELLSAYSWFSLLVPGTLHAMLLLLTLCLPALLLCAATRSWGMVFRVTAQPLIFAAAAGLLFIILALYPALTENALTGVTLSSAASLAAESLLSVMLLTPHSAVYSSIVGEHGLLLGSVETQPILNDWGVLFFQALYLVSIAFSIIRCAKLRAQKQKLLSILSCFVVYVLILVEAALLPEYEVSGVKNYLLFSSALPVYYLLYGLLHWTVLYVVAAFAAQRQ